MKNLRYETQIRVFFLLFVLVLILINFHSIHLYYRSRNAVREMELAAVRHLTTAFSKELEPQLRVSDLRDPGLAANFQLIAERYPVREAFLYDDQGRLVRTVALTDAASLGAVPLDRAWTARLKFNPSVAEYRSSTAGADLFLSGFALRDSFGEATGYAVLVVEQPRYWEGEQRARLLLTFQLLALVVVVLAIVAFSRWLVVPYRKLMKTAESATAPGGGARDELAFLVQTFQGLFARLKEKEKELERLHRMEKERAERTEAFSEKVVSSIQSALFTVDRQGTILTFNPAAEEIFGRSRSDVVGKPYGDLVETSSQFTDLLEQCLKQERSGTLRRVEIRTRKDQRKYLGISVFPLKERGENEGALCLISDLTEIIELQQQVKLRENFAALGEMSAGIAHEFKNSLATIAGYAQLLERVADSPDMRNNAQAIAEETRTSVQMVTRFLEFARPYQLNPVSFLLDEVLARCVADLQGEERFRHIQFELSPSDQQIHGDPVLVRRALANLLRNAAESIPPDAPSARVSVECTVDPGAPRRVRIRITDTGTGIAPQNLKRIFVPFHTTKASGTGLGLAISQKIILFHNGRIEASSHPGTGSTFTVVLPLAAD
ncbi:MAG: PAS domain-containing protein [Acidobacteria bacterium]|nr:PAS domain-containing protein [Acidobacteriota bacterium]